MSDFRDLRHEQVRQMIDVEQIFLSYQADRTEYHRRFSGAMSWKTVRGHDYLYRKAKRTWNSLGPRSSSTELAYDQFKGGRTRTRNRLSGLARRLDEMAPVNRALQLGRVPSMSAKIVRALDGARLLGTAVEVVGTHAMFAYERLAGVHIASGHLATGDVDLLFDSRARLKLLAADVAAEGIVGILRKLDRSFDVIGKGGFRAVNRDGYMVDLIQPLPKKRMTSTIRNRIGSSDGDLTAVEIEGLGWLVNSPKLATTVMDDKGYPFKIVTPDPRAFALHKAWLAKRDDREPPRRRRDEAQARLVAKLVATRLPHLTFDDPALAALPLDLRRHASDLLEDVPPESAEGSALRPDW